MRWILLLLAFFVLGCGNAPAGEKKPGVFARTLAGSDDVELTYRYESAAAAARFGEDLRALVIRRLGAAQVAADVTEGDHEVHIIVDEGLAPIVDEVITWTGTLAIVDPDETVRLSPRADDALTAAEEGDEHWYEGARADVIQAIETWPIDKDHRIVAEPMWGHTLPTGRTKWRTRVVKVIPVGELGDGARMGWGNGPTLRIRGLDGTLAAAVIHDAKERKAPPIAVRGRISLGRPTIEGDGMILSFGTGAEAYARAQRERQLFLTPRLPPLHRSGAMGLPPNRTLATACLVVPILLSLAWLLFVRRFDRAHPEPIWLVAVTFVCGVLSTVPAGLAELLLANASPWLDPRLVTFGGQWFAFPLALAVFTAVVGLSEEGAKRIAAQFAIRRPEFDEPVDGIVYGIVASLGFAAAENVRYFAVGRLAAPLVIARCFMSVPAHMFFGALWGYALGAKLINPRTRRWAWLLLAAIAHGLFDALLSTEGAGLLAVFLNLGLASVFVVLVRRALRHGVVSEEMLAIRPEDRALFRVGRPGLFWLSAFLLHLLAFGIFVLGAYYQLARHRPSPLFVVGSSVLLALLAFAALGVSTTVPLDVVVDDYGVTFAGAARPWRKIRAVTRHHDRVDLECEDGPIRLGPAAPPMLERIAQAIEARLYGDGGERLSTLESRR